jgi:hypothetical protein
MVQLPIVVALVPCHLVIVEESTRNITLVNAFQRLSFTEFPSPPYPFAVYAVLTDGLGDMELRLAVSETDTLDEIYGRSSSIRMADPLRQQRMWWRIRSCSFPEPGRYQISLLADKQMLAQCVIDVAPRIVNDG